MKKILFILWIITVLLTGCTHPLQVETDQHALIFDQNDLPEGLLKTLKSNKVIHIGEYHNNDAHEQFLTQLILELESHNLLLIEMSHALEWIVEDFTLGALESMPAFMDRFTQVDFHAIRAYNQKVEDEKKIRVKTIDINHSPQFLAVSIQSMMDLGRIEPTEAIISYLDNYADEEEVLKLKESLRQEKETLVLNWGEKPYQRLNHMVAREIESIYCRKPLEEGDMTLRMKRREAVMKETVEMILATYDQPAIINTGFNHTQKNHYLGTEQEWLGEYLEFVSPIGKGNTYHLVVVPIEGKLNWSDDGTKKRSSSIFDYTGSGELFKTMGQLSEKNSVFLDFNASDFFKTERMKMNYHYDIIELIPYHQFDGVLLLSEFVEIKQ